MELLGGASWWLPGWLDRLLPTVSFEPAGDGGDGSTEPGERQPVPVGS